MAEWKSNEKEDGEKNNNKEAWIRKGQLRRV